MNICVVCEKPVIEHNFLKNVYYCNSVRCTRLGVLSVFVLTLNEKPKESEPKVPPIVKEKIKDDKNLPKS